MSIFTDPHKVLENIWESITGTASDVYAFVKPTIAMFQRDGRKALIAAATAAVAQMATTDLSTSDKREEALKLIGASLASAGLAFIESEARVALEMAYQALKGASA
jgi:Na+/H+-dicarboxylate symporter